MRCTRLFLILASVSLLTAPASGQFAQPDTLYDGGSLSFAYAQTPFPFYSGEFAAEGEGLEPDGTLPPDATAAVGGAAVAAGTDSTTTVIYAATVNPGGTFDGALIALRTLGALTAGSYPVDLENGTALFLYIDEAQEFSLPESQDMEGVMEWLEGLNPERVLVSLTGSIVDGIAWVTALNRNKVTQTTTTLTLRNDADSGNIATSAVSDDGTTATRGEFA